jgi:hypothetical protein
MLGGELVHRRVTAMRPDWTDANEHDPGVTILVVLAFALTALGALGAAYVATRTHRRRRATRHEADDR